MNETIFDEREFVLKIQLWVYDQSGVVSLSISWHTILAGRKTVFSLFSKSSKRLDGKLSPNSPNSNKRRLFI